MRTQLRHSASSVCYIVSTSTQVVVSHPISLFLPSISFNKYFSSIYNIPGTVRLGSPIPRSQNRAAEQEVSGWWVSKPSSAFTVAPHCLHYHLNSGKQVQGPHWLCIMVNCVHYISQHNNNRSKRHNKCNVFESSQNKSPHLSHGKIVFHKTAPWCQKFWGLLMQRMYVCLLSHFSHVQLFTTICTVACQAPLSMEFSRQEYWSG